jgi:hypothetical protein
MVREYAKKENTKEIASRSLLDPEDGNDILLRNVCRHPTDHTALYPKR